MIQTKCAIWVGRSKKPRRDFYVSVRGLNKSRREMQEKNKNQTKRKDQEKEVSGEYLAPTLGLPLQLH